MSPYQRLAWDRAEAALAKQRAERPAQGIDWDAAQREWESLSD